MSAILPGYNYDIFISYRQKDNRHDGWVTEFVKNLKDELESTFKEEISVYFDINPHDGLLETYDVDESLKEKLKCLIFIPIISRTYCDPKSFAWEHEFKAFIAMASNDQFGLKVKLPNGNVASRVLPVKIHNLAADDNKMIEGCLDSHLRGIEFTYSEPGVNRPLKPEDNPGQNLNGTKYNNQINKVANAISEIFTGLKYGDNKEKNNIKLPDEPAAKKIINKTKILIGTFLCILIFSGIYFAFQSLKNDMNEKSIAVLPFKSLSSDPENQYKADGMMDAITLHLSKIKNLRVLGRTTTEQYRNPDKTPAKIGHELQVSYVLEGSYQDFAGNVKLIVQLINTGKEGHVWGNEYSIKDSEILSLQSDVAKAVAAELNAAITPEETHQIEKKPTTNLTAYDFYQRGKAEYDRFRLDNKKIIYLENAENLYKKALENDPKFAAAYTGLADVYWTRNWNKEYLSENYMDTVLILANKALSLDKKSSDAYHLRGNYFNQRGRSEDALKEFDKSIEFNPSDWSSYQMRGNIYFYKIGDLEKSIYNFHKAISVYHGEFLPGLYQSLAYAYLAAGFSDQSKIYFENALKLNNDSLGYFYSFADVESGSGNFQESAEYLGKAYRIDSTNLNVLNSLGFCYSVLKQYENAFRYNIEALRHGIDQDYGLIFSGFYCQLGFNYMQLGQKEKADHYLRKQIEYSRKQIETGRSTSFNDQKYGNMAITYSLLGNKDEALRNIDLIIESALCYPVQYSYYLSDPKFDNLRNEAEFQIFLREYKEKADAQHERVRKWLEKNDML